ncbi:MAG: hypothetical protein WBP16_04545 [Ferruginibacter sp.]
MKKQSTRFLSPLNGEGIIKLTSEVKEILVPDYKKIERRILSTADLWNIQRNRRARQYRKYM